MPFICLMLELIAISLVFYLALPILTHTGIAERLYRPGYAHGPYVLEIFWGMACAAAFLQLASLIPSSAIWAKALQSVLSPALSGLAVGMSMFVVGLCAEGVKRVFGREEAIGLFVAVGLIVLFMALLVYLFSPKSDPCMLSSSAAFFACLLGVCWVLYLARPETNSFAVAACFVFGFISYGVIRFGCAKFGTS